MGASSSKDSKHEVGADQDNPKSSTQASATTANTAQSIEPTNTAQSDASVEAANAIMKKLAKQNNDSPFFIVERKLAQLLSDEQIFGNSYVFMQSAEGKLRAKDVLLREAETRFLKRFLTYVAYGDQDKAEAILKNAYTPPSPRISDESSSKTPDSSASKIASLSKPVPPEKYLLSIPASIWLESKEEFTDYSGRTFDCTAYEYAYWAKDTHMCRMLETYMSEETKAFMAERIKKMERLDESTAAAAATATASGQPVGLTYSQYGSVHHSAHFDLSPLKKALQEYVDEYDAWKRENKWDEIEKAWLAIGLAQRDVPVHVINEYCRPDRSFHPLPDFKENKLLRVVTFYNHLRMRMDSFFPVGPSSTSCGVVDFSLFRGACRATGYAHWAVGAWGGRRAVRVEIDLAAICGLDEVRTADLRQSRENLGLIDPGFGLGSRPS